MATRPAETKGTIKLEQRDVADLIPYARNSRTHSDEQVAQIAASIREFGFTNPILTDGKNGIIAGHGRLQAARKLGLTQVPTIPLDSLTEAQKRAYVIADNKLALNAGWDAALLSSELAGLGEDGFDLTLLGFNEDELAALLADKTEGLTDADEVPEAPADPVSVLGDVWTLGKHRIVCGDSTDADAVAKCLNGVVPHLMVTDPPYGVEYDANWRNEADRANGKPYGAHAVGKVENDNRADWSEAWALFPGDVAYVWHAGNMAHTVAESLVANGLNIRAQIIWNKSNMVISRGDYHPKHEPCWYAVRKGKVGHYVGGRKQTTVWDIDKPQKSETGHSTQKPVECMKRPIENNSSAGQAVYEPFSGSGTTIIAGEMTCRSIHAIELSPAYVDVAVTRWQDFTGQEAIHAESGETFNAMKAGKIKEAA
jgi:DNA modification methylase